MTKMLTSTLMVLCVGGVQAGFWDAVSSGANSVGGAINGAASQATESANNFVQNAENQAGSAVDGALQKACDLKIWEDISNVNGTMVSQLRLDCETQASRAPYMHDNIYGSCITMGLYNINRTLEKQLPNMKDDCMDMLHNAPGDVAGTLSRWSEQSTKTLTEQVGPSITGAVEKAKAAVSGHGSDEPQQKWSAFGSRSSLGAGASAYAVPVVGSFAFSLALCASLAAAIAAWRRRTSSLLADEDDLGRLLDLEQAATATATSEVELSH